MEKETADVVSWLSDNGRWNANMQSAANIITSQNKEIGELKAEIESLKSIKS